MPSSERNTPEKFSVERTGKLNDLDYDLMMEAVREAGREIIRVRDGYFMVDDVEDLRESVEECHRDLLREQETIRDPHRPSGP
jgi:hypothetical protein